MIPFKRQPSIPAILIIGDDCEVGQALRCLVSSVMTFFTLTQIAFLVYAYRGAAAKEYKFIHYRLFVTHFPPEGGFHAIARKLKPSGYVIIGLHNWLGRLPTLFRRGDVQLSARMPR